MAKKAPVFRSARRKPIGYSDRRVGVVVRAREQATDAEVLAQAALAFAAGKAKVSKPVGRPARGGTVPLSLLRLWR